MTRVPPFMGNFSNEDATWFVDVGVRRRVPAGEAVIREGEPVDDLYVILEGTFVVEWSQPGMKEIPPLGPGEILGEMSYVRGTLPISTVRAMTDAVVLCIPRTALSRKIAADAGFAARFHKVVSEFVADRLFAYVPPEAKPAPGPPPDSMRVYEMIERMLRGELP